MKTVGIITMHRPNNYGSYLQTFATYKFITELGYDTKVIDYAYPTEYHRSLVKTRKTDNIKQSWMHRKLSGLFRRLLHIDTARHLDKMRKFYQQNIKLTRTFNSAEELRKAPPLFDIYVTGSDQVWNPEFTGKDTSFLLSWIPDGKRRIAYSASFSIRELPSDVTELYESNLKKYNAIGIRERSDILTSMNGIKGEVVLDPTFLYNKSQWISILGDTSKSKGKYILCYLLNYKFNPYPYAYNVIEHLQKQTGYKVVIIDGDPADTLRGYRIAGNLGPEDFVSLFAHAGYVVTNSFHGTAFAINFEKPFLTIVNSDTKSKDNRQSSLIDEFGISSQRVIRKGDNLNNINPDIVVEWHERLTRLREESIRFLVDALNDKS